MLTETGRVVAIEADSLWVETIRQSTCGSCSAQKGCGHGLLNQMRSGRSNYLRVLLGSYSAEGFSVDNQVRIAIPERVVLRGSFVVYMLPLLTALLFAGLASGLSRGGDLLSIAGAVGGFMVGIALVRWHAHIHRHDSQLQPQLLGLVGSAQVQG